LLDAVPVMYMFGGAKVPWRRRKLHMPRLWSVLQLSFTNCCESAIPTCGARLSKRFDNVKKSSMSRVYESSFKSKA